MNIQGKLHAKFDTQEVSDRFKKRDFVVEYSENPMYPQYISFQTIQDRVDLIDAFEVGDMLDVSFNLKGRSWTSPQGEVKYFNTIEAWRIQPVQGVVQQTQPPQPVEEAVLVDDDDLPF